ncbi:MAG: NfeD family protein [Rhodospirillales bacterium]|nr:NfeD family protein [Rhodospirillales bacterium]
MEFLETLTFWQWGILAIVLIVMEVLLPGVIFLWIGIGAGITGGVLFLFPDMSWQQQFICFALFSIGSTVAGRMWVAKNPIKTDRPNLNQRGRQYIGQIVPLCEPIINGFGMVQIGDSRWKVKGPDLGVGCNVCVVDVEGAILTVKEADNN